MKLGNQSLPWILGLALGVVCMTTSGCSGRKGTKVVPGNHSTYPHHSHDENKVPHPRRFGDAIPPPHEHSHGPTWK